MISKRLLVLANSTKHHPMRCVAGRELLGEIGGIVQWGGWIRPVSSHDEGALNSGERCLAGGIDPKPLDIVRTALAAPTNDPLQPENWLIGQSGLGIKDSAMDAHSLLSLIEEPESLWFDPVQKSDRASESFLRRLSKFQSLYLIRPEAFHFQIRSRVWDGYSKKQQRGLFNYKGRHYDLALTDPLISQKYFPDYPRTADGYVAPKDPRQILLCVSLTPPFHDLHYKVIATVLELSA